MNILVITGTQKFQFNRLIKAADILASRHHDYHIFAQIGASEVKPKYMDYRPFIDKDEMQKRLKGADIVLTHGGTGSIISALKMQKPVIAVARLARYGEHVDDHQKEIVERFREDGMLVEATDLTEAGLQKAIMKVMDLSVPMYKSGTDQIIAELKKRIEEC